ncbi:MAG: RNA methyltransferase [Bacteroidetes bacterium]|nr:RNA methyltransferase [Bacteroidota bacterium]
MTAKKNKPLSDKKQKLLEYLLTYVSEHKQALFEEKIRFRTKYITVVLEDIFQPHNASAVLRTCDCFGVQDIHIIENQNKYEVNPDVALGSSKWLKLMKYNTEKQNTIMAYQTLKKQGYRIVATTPHKNDILLEELSLDQKTALVFGTEMRGLTNWAIDNADAWVKIPMYGFTESFNISVSAAIILHYLTEKLRKSDIAWQLNQTEITDIKLDWVKNTIKRAELLEQKFLKNS